jgi:hypothetical protein
MILLQTETTVDNTDGDTNTTNTAKTRKSRYIYGGSDNNMYAKSSRDTDTDYDHDTSHIELTVDNKEEAGAEFGVAENVPSTTANSILDISDNIGGAGREKEVLKQ